VQGVEKKGKRPAGGVQEEIPEPTGETPSKSGCLFTRPRSSRKRAAPSDSEESSDDDDADEENAGLDLIGKKFYLPAIEVGAEGECLVTEPGVHVDPDTGEEFDMLWYKYLDTETEEEANDCSQVSEVREWVRVYEICL